MPGVVTWFRVYAAAMAVMYVLVVAAGVFFALAPAEWLEAEEGENIVLGIIFIGVGLPCAALYAAGLFLPPRPWVWVYDLVLIAIGFGSCCILPASVALLVFWIRPETKAYFNRL